MRQPIPLRERKLDWIFLPFFVFNLGFVSWMFDLEQVLITDVRNFEYPIWPPKWVIDLSHWWGANFDPALYERPVWWRMTIWIDVLLFGPYYCFALYAFIKGRDWIRIPTIIYASIMLTNVTIILGEEVMGTYPASNLPAVLAANASWVIVPVILIWRMWSAGEHPFTRETGAQEATA